MGTRLYVGNIPYNTTDTDLRTLFSRSGRTVTEVKIVTDRETGQSRGFAFVQMATDQDAQATITELNGANIGGRAMVVNEARDRVPGGPGGAARPGPGSGPPRSGGPRVGGQRPGGPLQGGPPGGFARGHDGDRGRPPGGQARRGFGPTPDKEQGRRRNRDRDREREKQREEDFDDEY